MPLTPKVCRRLAAIAGSAFLCAGCGGSTASPGTPTAKATSIQVSGVSTLNSPGATAQYQAIATLTDGTQNLVTSQVAWSTSNPSQLKISTSGLATYVSGLGPVTLTATYQGVQGTLQVNLGLAPEDCSSYDATSVSSVDLGDGTFSIRTNAPGGGQFLWLLAANGTDAANDVALMQRYTTICSIGRNNGRPNRSAYITLYWKSPTGVATTISPEDCRSYSASALQVASAGTAGWAVTDGVTQFLLLDTQADAMRGLSVAQQFSAQCFIGRGNTLPNSAEYVTPYYK